MLLRVVTTVALVMSAAVGSSPDAWATPTTRVFLNGRPTPVFFNDGDSFAVLEGPHKGTKARLSGFNTLESFGPVHSWGDWTATELYVVAKQGTLNARRGEWHCTSDLKRDGYGRILWECPDLIEDDLRKGLAHAYSVDAKPAEPHSLELQKLAQAEKRGIWAKGIPGFILTSIHSADEGGAGPGGTYNRLISTVDGHTEKWTHEDVYAECQVVCHPTGACMVNIPFNRRFGPGRAACLKH